MLRVLAVDHVLSLPADDDLSRDRDFLTVFIADRALILVAVIKVDGDCRFGYARLSAFVNEILQRLRANLKTPTKTNKIDELSSTTMRWTRGNLHVAD